MEIMKYIKAYKIFENNSDLISKLKEYDIRNYTINSDQTIDVNGSVNFTKKELIEIPFKFREVSGYFYCSNNKLTSLRGCPTEIGNNFYCSNNKLTSLEFCASEIDSNFHCYYNKLTMLDCSSYVKGDIYCWKNNFTEEPEFFGDCEGKIIWRDYEIYQNI